MLQLFTVGEERWELKETSPMQCAEINLICEKNYKTWSPEQRMSLCHGCVLPGLSFSD